MNQDPARLDRVFVYGTLRPGFQNPGRDILEAHGEHVGPARIAGRLAIIQGLPALLVAQGPGEPVAGDVYRLTQMGQALAALDRYEGLRGPGPSPYERRRMTVELLEEGPCEAWVYVWTGPSEDARPVPEGDYAAFDERSG